MDTVTVVWYSDGGCTTRVDAAPLAGCGIHGYAYTATPTKKGIGHPKAGAGPKGYQEDKKGEIVDVVGYIDIHRNTPLPETNNQAELLGLITVLSQALQPTITFEETEYAITEVYFHLDSEYCLNGLLEHLSQWRVSQWKRADGVEIKNRLQWEEVDRLSTALLQRFDWTLDDLKAHCFWVKGHSGNVGNHEADFLATLAKHSPPGTFSIRHSVAKGYWKVDDVEINPLLTQNVLYFNANTLIKNFHHPQHWVTGNHGPKDDEVGKAVDNTTLSIVALTHPDPVLHEVMTYQAKVIEQDPWKSQPGIHMIRLNNFLNRGVYKKLQQYGTCYMVPTSEKTLKSLDQREITGLIDPPYQWHQFFDVVYEFEQLFLKLRNEVPLSKAYRRTDITTTFFEANKKGVQVIKPALKPQVKSVTVEAEASLDLETTLTLPVQLTFGLDVLKRNTLMQIAHTVERLEVIIWRESPIALRYATYLKSQLGHVLYVSPYRNRLLQLGGVAP